MESVMDMAQGFFGGETLGRVSAWLHETPASTRAAVQDALPASVLGLANQASSEEGSRALLGRFQRGDYPHLDPEELNRAVHDPEATDRIVQSNKGFMEGMFGGKLPGVVDVSAEHAGVSRSAMSKLLALAAPVVLGMIGKRAVDQNLDPGGLRNLLSEQSRMAAKVLPHSLTKILVPAGAATAASSVVARPLETGRNEIAPVQRRSAFPWWIFGLLAAVAVAIFSWGRRSHRPAEQVVSQAVATTPAISAGNVALLRGFLDGNTAVPQRFVIEDLRFSPDSADIEAGTRQVLDEIAGVLRDFPKARIRIEGHTDATGSPEANRILSQSRADVTKRYLVERGIGAGRIDTIGFGADRPTSSNDSAEGRARNRRTELIVISR
jgi:outer membrane protein OmpA-like peptidoglycan-associated protein